jgi:hypothetical protein
MRRSVLALAAALALGAAPGTGTVAGAQEGPAQPPQQKRVDSVPREYRPPAGMCRVWIDGVPPAQQPAPTDCPSAVKNKPANGRVIYGEEVKGGKAAPLPVKGFSKPPKIPPLIPPEQTASAEPRGREPWENRRITDEQLFGDRPATTPASSFPGTSSSSQGPGSSPGGYGPMGSYGVPGQAFDPRYFTGNPNVRPPGYGSTACLDRDGDGWCDDLRYGPPVCLDRDTDGRCDDLPAFASQAYPQTLPIMRAALDVVRGQVSVEVMQWLGTNEFTVRIPDQGRGGSPWRAIFLDQNNELLQVWTDTDRDGRANRVEVFRNGRRVKLIQR